MCRFTFYMGQPIKVSSLITEPHHSLINQSFESTEREEPLNGDGFGLAWYKPQVSEEPGLFKSITPAWSNTNLYELCKIIETPCVLAHVRAATQRLAVAENNCHPFKKGPVSFMHNGDIGGFLNIKRMIIESLSDEAFHSILGSTDTEHLFAIFLDEYWKQEESDDLKRLANAMKSSILRVNRLIGRHCPGEFNYLNLVATNGKSAVAARFTTDPDLDADTLYLSHGLKYICEDGLCKMVEPKDYENAVIVSSEPLSQDKSWSMIPVNHMVLIEDGHLIDQVEMVI